MGAPSAILCRKRYLTIFEMLLVIAILGVASSVIAINVNKALIGQRFQTEVGQVVSAIQLAQDLMLVVNSDVHLKFAKEGEGIRYWLELDTQLPDGLRQAIMRTRKPLKTIHGVFFKDALVYKPMYGEIDLKFLSHGSVMSQGMLHLSTSQEEVNPPANALHSYICLPGYPYPVGSADDKDAAEKQCQSANDNAYDERIMRDTFARLPEHLKLPEEVPDEEQSEAEQDQNGTAPASPVSTKKQTSKAGTAVPAADTD